MGSGETALVGEGPLMVDRHVHQRHEYPADYNDEAKDEAKVAQLELVVVAILLDVFIGSLTIIFGLNLYFRTSVSLILSKSECRVGHDNIIQASHVLAL